MPPKLLPPPASLSCSSRALEVTPASQSTRRGHPKAPRVAGGRWHICADEEDTGLLAESDVAAVVRNISVNMPTSCICCNGAIMNLGYTRMAIVLWPVGARVLARGQREGDWRRSISSEVVNAVTRKM